MRVERESGEFNNESSIKFENKVVKETETRIQGILVIKLFI